MNDKYSAAKTYSNNNSYGNNIDKIIELYERAIQYVRRAEAFKEDLQELYNNIEGAVQIIFNLKIILNKDKCKDTAEALDKFYEDMINLLYAITLKNQDNYKIVINSLKQMQDLWREINLKSSNSTPTRLDFSNLSV